VSRLLTMARYMDINVMSIEVAAEDTWNPPRSSREERLARACSARHDEYDRPATRDLLRGIRLAADELWWLSKTRLGPPA